MKANSLTLALCLLTGCTYAPPVVQNQGGSISESGKADSGFIARSGDGFKVEPSVRLTYLLNLKTYGSRLNPANPAPDAGWALQPDNNGLLWCSAKVAADNALMLFYQRQDAKL